VRRQIVGFHQDEEGDWVAELSCLHGQHVRHRPPFFDRPWVVEDAARQERVGTEIDCPLCDRAELPEGLQVARTAGPFDRDSLPAGLRRTHRVADGTWGVLRVTEGVVDIRLDTDPPIDRRVARGETQAIPPGVPHDVSPGDVVVMSIDFLVR
jgi:tellurite methyltransferase